MSISISRIAISLALLATVLPAFSTLSNSSASSSLVSSADSSTGSCQSYIDWNSEKGVWRLNCNSKRSCCGYESIRKLDGSYLVWCDCESDGWPPECCHEALRAYPNQPGRAAVPEVGGDCESGCTELAWASVCVLTEVRSAGAPGIRTSATCVSE